MRRTLRPFHALAAIGLWLVIGSVTALAQQPSAFQPALTVNDEPITWYDIDQRMRLLDFTGVRGGTDLQQVAVDQLIEDRLKLQAGASIVQPISDEMAQELLRQFAATNNTELGRIEAALQRSGATRSTLVKAFYAETVWRDVIRSRYGALAEPTELEVDQAVALAVAGRNTEYRLAEIVIPTARRGEAQTLALAQDLSRQLSAGGDFATAARRYSASVSAREGGTIGWVPESSLPPPVAEALAETRVGGVTRPLPAQGAVALLKVLETRQIDLEGMGTVSFGLLAISAQDPNPVTAIARVDALIAERPGCADAEARAIEAGLTANRSEPTPVTALPEPVRNVVGDLQEGEIGGPVPVQGGAAAFIVCQRLEGVPPAVRDRIREQLRQERFQRLANSFLQELRGDAVIERR
jgi:peptidyl-prolyl cis-trans isomerase SurA